MGEIIGAYLLIHMGCIMLIAFGGCELLPDDMSEEAEIGVMLMAPLFAAYVVLWLAVFFIKLFVSGAVWLVKNSKAVFLGGLEAMVRGN